MVGLVIDIENHQKRYDDKYGDKYGIEQYKTRSGLEFLCQPVYNNCKGNDDKFVLKYSVHTSVIF